MGNKIEVLREYIDYMVINKERGQFWFVDRHMHSVSQFASLLAIKRHLDPEIATIIGLLHDVHTLFEDDSIDHAKHGSIKANEILKTLNILTENEIQIICNAIKNHSSKNVVHDKYSELIKDADVLTHYFYNITLPIIKYEKERLHKLQEELGL